MHPSHDAKEVAAPDFGQIFVGETLGLQTAGQLNEFGSVGQSRHTAVAVEIGADAHVVYAGHRNHVQEVAQCVVDGGVRIVRAQETGVEGALRHSPGGGEGTQLVVGQVARVVAQGASR